MKNTKVDRHTILQTFQENFNIATPSGMVHSRKKV